MRRAKLLIIVTNPDTRRRLLTTWREFLVAQPHFKPTPMAPESERPEGPVAFTQLTIREGLGLAVFVVDGSWQREYVCQALARQVDGFCLLVNGEPAELELAGDLLRLLAGGSPGLVAATNEQSVPLIRTVLGFSAETAVPVVDSDSRASVNALISDILERLAAIAAA